MAKIRISERIYNTDAKACLCNRHCNIHSERKYLRGLPQRYEKRARNIKLAWIFFATSESFFAFIAKAFVWFSRARHDFLAGSSACRGRLDKSLPQVRETPIYGCFGIGCPAVLVRCMLLYAICLARTTPAGKVDLVADLRVGLLLLSRGSSRTARTT